MKKIAVSTLVNAKENYGQLLQAYALQAFLKKKGYDAVLIRYKRKFSLKDEKGIRKILKFFYQLFKTVSFSQVNKSEIVHSSPEVIARHKHFENFYNEYFTNTEKMYYTIDELRNEPPKADVYVAGSDQIWNWGGRYGYNPVYFLQFGGNGIKRVGYAVGMSKIVASKEAKKELKKYLKRFNSLALREPTGVPVLKECGFSDPKVVADPTLLLEKEDYLSLIKNDVKPQKDFLLGYFINFNSKEELDWSSIREYLNENDLDFKYISSEGYLKSINQLDEYKNEFYTVPEWLEAYSNAKCILTTSYHGLLFSIIMRKPFLFFFIDDERTVPGRNRPKYILSQLGLESRIYFKNSDRTLKEQLDEPINWSEVETKLEKLRNYSIDYLINAIEN